MPEWVTGYYMLALPCNSFKLKRAVRFVFYALLLLRLKYFAYIVNRKTINSHGKTLISHVNLWITPLISDIMKVMNKNKQSTTSDAVEAEVVNSPGVSFKPINKMPLKQRRFAKYYKETGNATKSAKLAGYSEASAHVQGSVLLRNPNVLRLLDEAKEEAEATLLVLMRTADSEQVRRQAANDVLDRTIGKPIQRSESVNVNITVESMLDNTDD